jgi:WD40 repeat protein
MRVWDVNSGALLQTITISSQVVNALDISPDGQYAVTAADTSLRIWRLSDYSPVGSFSTGDLDEPIAVSWSPTANFIVCGTSNAGVALFDVSTTVGIEELPNLTAQVYPNPCPGVLNVTWPSSEPIERAELYDLNGRLLLTCNHLDHENTLQIDLKAQNSVLMLRLTAQDGRSTTRMIYKQ